MMDRALKERIIGATVLVVLAVLIVPVFLDGPSTGTEIVSQSVTLPGQGDQPRRQQTIVLERDRAEPVPALAEPKSDGANVTRPAGEAVAEARPRPEPAKVRDPLAKVDAPGGDEPASGRAASVPVAAPAEASSTGMFAVQLGSFSSRENAERLAADLRKDGYAAFLSQLDTPDGALHRVRVGPQKDREAAEAVAARLATAGHKGQVVPHP